MIDIIIYYLHIIGAIYAFAKIWQNGSAKEGGLAVAIIALVFSIGWALTGTVAHTIMPDSWDSTYFTVDTLSLILLVIPESFFFNFFFVKNK